MSGEKAETNVNIFSRGDRLYLQRKYEEAEKCFQTVLNQSSISHADVARCLNSLGTVNVKLQKSNEAIDYFNKLLQLLLNTDLPNQQESIIKCHMSIGMTYAMKEDYDQAIHAYQEALTILGDNGTKSELAADVYKNLGNIYSRKHEFDSALKCFTTALDIDHLRLDKDHPIFGKTYEDIGYMYDAKKAYGKALNYFQKARNLWLKSLRPTHIYLQSIEKKIKDVEIKRKTGTYVFTLYRLV